MGDGNGKVIEQLMGVVCLRREFGLVWPRGARLTGTRLPKALLGDLPVGARRRSGKVRET